MASSSSATLPEYEVIVLSDSSSEEEDIPGSNASVKSGCGDGAPSGSNITPSVKSGITEVSAVTEFAKIDRVDSHNEPKNKSENLDILPTSSPKKKCTNDSHLAENIYTQFQEDAQKKIAEKDEWIAEILEENEKLKSQLMNHRSDFERLRKRNVKLEEERRQRKSEGMSLGRLRSKMVNLYEFFESLILKLEQMPVNPMDPQVLKSRKDVDVLKREVGDLFQRVQRKLKRWDKNQKEIYGELESTKKVMERLNEMVMVVEKFRTKRNKDVPIAATVSAEKSEENKEPIPSTSQAMLKTHFANKKMMPPPALLPLASLPISVATNSKNIEQCSEGTSMVHDQNAISGVRPVSEQSSSQIVPPEEQQGQKETDSLVTTLSDLYTNPLITGQDQSNPILSSPSEKTQSSSFIIPLPTPKPIVYVGTSVIRKVTKLAQPMQPPSPPIIVTSNSSSNKPMTRMCLPQLTESKFVPVPIAHASTSMTSSSKWPMTPTYPSLSQPLQQSSSVVMANSGNTTLLKSPQKRSVPLHRSTGSQSTQKEIPVTKHSLPPLLLPVLNPNALPQSIEVPVPAVHQREAIEIYGGPSTSPAGPSRGQKNICGLCGMSFNTLVHLKLHHTVVHSKGPVPGTTFRPVAQSVPLRRLEFPSPTFQMARRNLHTSLPPHQGSVMDTNDPSHKRPCLGQLNPSLSSSFSSGPRTSVLPSHLEIPPSFGRIPTTDVNVHNSNVNSNENSAYPFL